MQLFDRRYLKYFDWTSFALITAIAACGLLFVFSATYKVDEPYSIFFKKQLFGIITGFGIYLLCCLIDYRHAILWGYTGYIAVIVLLFITMVKGTVGMGAQRWVGYAFIKIQPSEFAKLLFPAFVTYYCCIKREIVNGRWTDFIPLIIPLGICSFLVLKQPDLGTAIVIASSGLLMLWVAGLSNRFFLYSFLLIILAAPLLWSHLKPYQKNRVMVFCGQGDTNKERYQIEQAKIAIGSGGLTGKGVLQGTQNSLQFIPAGRTDFIFAVLCEETGYIGALFLLFLYTLLFLRLCWIILTIRPREPRLFAAGLILPIMVSAFINVCMVLDLLPVVGISLPLMSYGLSQTWTTFASLGLFNSIALRRFYING